MNYELRMKYILIGTLMTMYKLILADYIFAIIRSIRVFRVPINYV